MILAGLKSIKNILCKFEYSVKEKFLSMEGKIQILGAIIMSILGQDDSEFKSVYWHS